MLTESTFAAISPAIVLEGIKNYVAIDLSAGNSEIQDLDTSAHYTAFIEAYLREHNADAAYGGYNEIRNLYSRSEIFNDGNQSRNIHIGLDLWAPEGTSVLAAADGEIHSFNFNAGIGNYGPTIILQHRLAGVTFYTLYGHLDPASLEEIEIGQQICRGEAIGKLGASHENGDYAPHLHFQIIENIGSYFGDYPGVCSSDELQYYLDNCPDPNLLLKLDK